MDASLIHIEEDQKYYLETVLTDQQNSLKFILKCFGDGKVIKKYEQTLNNENLNQQLQLRFFSVQNIYECVKEKDLHFVNPEQGSIAIISHIIIKNKSIEQKCIINLKQVQVSNEDNKQFSQVGILERKVSTLEKRVQNLQLENEKLKKNFALYKQQLEESYKKFIHQTKVVLQQNKLRQQTQQLVLGEKEKKEKDQMSLQQGEKIDSSGISMPIVGSQIKGLEDISYGQQIPNNILPDSSKQQLSSQIQAVREQSLKEINELKKVLSEKLSESDKKIEGEPGKRKIQQQQSLEQQLKDLNARLKYTQFNACLAYIESKFSSQFVINGSYVRFNGKDGNWCHLISDRKKFNQNRLWYVSLRILHSVANRIRVGITNVEVNKNKRNSLNSKDDCYCFEGSQGRVYGVQGKKFSPFEQGDIIEVIYRAESISFCIKTKGLSQSYTYKKKQNFSEVFAPFVEMFDKGDAVQINYW